MRYSSKIARLSVFVLSAILLISIAVSFFADSVIKDWLEGKVAGAGEGQYSLQLEKLEISLIQNKIHLSGILLKTDSSGLENQPFVEAEARELTLTGISVFNYFFDDKLIIDQLLLEGLNLKLQVKGAKEGTSKPFDLNMLDIYPEIRDFAGLIRIDQFSIQNSSLDFQSHSKEDTVNFSVKILNIRHKDLLIGEDELFTSSRTFYSAWSDIKAEQVKFTRSGAENLQAETETIHLRTEQELGKLKVRAVTFLQKSEAEPDTLFFLSLDLFDLEGFNLNKLQEEKLAVSEKATIYRLHISYPAFESLPETGNVEADQEEKGNIYEFSLGNLLPDFTKSVKLGDLEVRKVSIREGNILSIEDGFLLARDVSVEDLSAFSENRFLHARELESGIAHFTIKAGEPAHHLRLSGIYLEAVEGKGSLLVKKIEAHPTAQNDLKNSLNFTAGQLSLTGFDVRRFPSGFLAAESLKISSPGLKLQIRLPPEGRGKDLNQEVPPFSVPDLTEIFPEYQKVFREISLEAVEISSSGFSAVLHTGGESKVLSYEHLMLEGRDVLIAENEMFSDARSFFSGETSLEIKDIKVSSEGNELWKAHNQCFNFRTREEYAFISTRSFHFLKLAGPETDTILFVKLPASSFQALNLNRFTDDQIVSLEKVVLSNLQYLSNSSDQEKEMPARKEVNHQAQAISSLNAGNYLPPLIKGVEIGTLEVNSTMLKEGNDFYAEKANISAGDIKIGRDNAWSGKQFLHAAVFESDFGELTFNFGEPNHLLKLADVHLEAKSGTGSLIIQDLLLVPDETTGLTSWVEAEINLLRLAGFNTSQLTAGTLKLDSLLAGSSKIVYHTPESPSQNDSPEKVSSIPDLYPLIAGELDSLKINFIHFPEADIRLAGAGGSFYGLHLPEAQLQFSDILIARGNAYLHDRVLHAADIRLQASSGILLFPDRVYSLLLNQVNLSTKDKMFATENLRYGFSGNFEKILEGETVNELYRFVSGRLLAEQIEWDKLLRDRKLVVGSFTARSPDVYVYKDFNKPEADVIKPMPYDIVHGIGFPVFIDKILVNDLNLTYEEMMEGAEQAGLVDLTDMEIMIMNFTNMKSRLVQKPEMTVIASGKLMGKGDFESTITVPLLDPDRPPRIRGSLDTLDITELNRIARYNSRVAIETGILYEVKWDFEAGEDYSYGDFEVSYENLTIQLSEPDSPDTTGLLKKAGSFLANVLVVDSNIAEEKSQEPKKVQFEQKRDKKRSFFNFYVKSLLAGLIEAVGVPFQ